jgi:Fe-Mn family superoxide dismutase
MLMEQTYRAKEFRLSGLAGISDETLEIHLGLYKGYVDQTNFIIEELSETAQRGKANGKNPLYAELRRHLGFELGGMVLHEYYFGNLAPKGRGKPGAAIEEPLGRSFGDFESWKRDFMAVGGLRGVGWAALCQDPFNGALSNHWIELHHQGMPAGFKPILVMDVWEHAFLLDYKPSERTKYMEAFFANVDWTVVNERLLNS